MIQSVRDHYATHLGRIYSWMLGGLDSALAQADLDVEALGLRPVARAQAVDLGAGFGMHAIALARRGYSVVAIDSDAALLRELAEHAEHANGLAIRTVVADLLDFRAHLDDAADLILCMGDTLTHLPAPADVTALFAEVAAALSSGGQFACTFRDYSKELLAENRFIPVRSSADRTLTCFLEYARQSVTVHDIIHELDGTQWRLSVSSYQKLRLDPLWVRNALAHCGFEVTESATSNRMVRLIAQRP